jgi:hypothetical protein
MAQSLTERYRNGLQGVLSCYDRIVVTGTLPEVCYAEGMTRFLRARGIRVFDYVKFAEPLRDRIRAGAEALAAAHGIEIEHLRKSSIRKEDVAAAVLKRRGEHPGLVHILSAMEACDSYQPWHDKRTHKTFLRPDSGKCLHYYFYFIDAELGLCSLRVPTWCPFRLQFHCNGHHWLARRMTAAGIGFTPADNTFLAIDDFERAQELADGLTAETLHHVLDRYAALCCPVLDAFVHSYHWSLMQAEYATDLVFRSPERLAPLYEQLIRQAVLAVKAEHVSSFLGKKLSPQLAQEIGSRFTTRIEGTCIKHRLGKAGVKMYDKFARVLRLETTINDVSFFKHHRKVEHKDGTTSYELAPLKKTIYSLIDLGGILLGCNRRYLEFLSALDDHSAGERALDRLTAPRRDGEQIIKGFNFFDRTEQALLRALQRPEFNIHGLRRADLEPHLPDLSPATLTRRLRKLRLFKVIKRVANTYRYYLTRLGRRAIAACCRLSEFTLTPALA